MLTGLLELPWWGYLLYAAGVTHVTIVSVTVYLHRHQAHRALDLHPGVAHFFRFWLWLTTGMVTRQWVAVHRKHHARCETAEDPHSPQVKGLSAVLWGGAFLYTREATRPETLASYGKGTPDDWIERRLYTPYHAVGILVMLAVDLVLLGAWGSVVWLVQMAWIPFWAAGVVNGIGHFLGYRNYDSADASTNIVPWGILIGGEELHNNHHAYPGSAKLSARRFEFDLGWLYIRLMQALALARVRRVAPAPARLVRAEGLDFEAVRAIAQRRLQVLARYGRDVVSRVYRHELRQLDDRRLRALFRRARLPLLREAAAVDEGRRQRLSELLDHSEQLSTVFQFKRRLNDIWSQAAKGPEAMARALQQWCRDAEESGIEALQDFARRLAGYRLVDA